VKAEKRSPEKTEAKQGELGKNGRASYQCNFHFDCPLNPAQPHRKPKGSSTQSSSTLGSYSSAALPPPQEQTKGGDTAPSVPVHGTVATKSTQVDLGWLAGPPEGTTPFTVVGLVRAPATEERERGSSAVEPLTRGTVDLSITDRPATPYHRVDSPSPTPNEANPNPNGSGSGPPPRLSPLGN
jgi:hypothetical protein